MGTTPFYVWGISRKYTQRVGDTRSQDRINRTHLKCFQNTNRNEVESHQESPLFQKFYRSLQRQRDHRHIPRQLFGVPINKHHPQISF